MGGYPQHFDFKINKIKKHFENLNFERKKTDINIFPPHFYQLKKTKGGKTDGKENK